MGIVTEYLTIAKESDTFWGTFPKHEVLMGMDTNTELAGHSDGFRVGDAVPNNDMSAGDEERANFFVNFMTKKGLVAQNTWTEATAPQEEMYTSREWDKHEMGNLAVGTLVDCVLTSGTVKVKSCRVEENTFMSTDHKAVFLGTDMSKEEKKHTNKTNIKNWKVSPQWKGKSEDLKIERTGWQETVEKMATTAG